MAGSSGDKGRDLPPFLDDFQAGRAHKPSTLSLFLDDFLANTDTPLLAKQIEFPSANYVFGGSGYCRGFWARPDSKVRLPAVLLVYPSHAWTEWMELNTRHLASIGYEVLSLGAGPATGTIAEERALAELCAGVRWLRGRSEVMPNRIGVVGWGGTSTRVLALASATSLQACIICEPRLPIEPALMVGLRETPVLAILTHVVSQKNRTILRKLLADQPVSGKLHMANAREEDFMGPPGPPERDAYRHEAAEDAWVAIYNFLEKHVEDARPVGLAAAAGAGQGPLPKQVATIADIMRAVNEPTGLRGALSKALEQEPKGDRQWLRIRSNAALVAEAGALLETRKPAKGPIDHWKKQARSYTAAAEAMVSAADQKDYPAMQRGLVLLAEQCAACHDEHR